MNLKIQMMINIDDELVKKKLTSMDVKPTKANIKKFLKMLRAGNLTWEEEQLKDIEFSDDLLWLYGLKKEEQS